MERIKIGETIGGVNKVLSIIGGEGKTGMGIVYVCYNTKWKFIVAMKTFQKRFFLSNEALESFKNEAIVWINLGIHLNIVRAYTINEFNDRPFIIMEYIAQDNLGRNTLSHFLQTPLSLERVLKWGIQFCFGIEYAYAHGISCHRDIKPDNIMITPTKDLKITDFGLAKVHTNQSSDKYKISGTPPWMAPEQFNGITNIKSDIYSFGVVLYQMINKGKLPFYAKTLDGFRKAHKENPVPKFKSILSKIINKCLAKKPEERYLHFQGLRSDLETINRDMGGPNIKEIKHELSEVNNHQLKGYSFTNLEMWDEAIDELEKGRILSIKAGIPDKEQLFHILNSLVLRIVVKNFLRKG